MKVKLKRLKISLIKKNLLSIKILLKHIHYFSFQKKNNRKFLMKTKLCTNYQIHVSKTLVKNKKFKLIKIYFKKQKIFSMMTSKKQVIHSQVLKNQQK